MMLEPFDIFIIFLMCIFLFLSIFWNNSNLPDASKRIEMAIELLVGKHGAVKPETLSSKSIFFAYEAIYDELNALDRKTGGQISFSSLLAAVFVLFLTVDWTSLREVSNVHAKLISPGVDWWKYIIFGVIWEVSASAISIFTIWVTWYNPGTFLSYGRNEFRFLKKFPRFYNFASQLSEVSQIGMSKKYRACYGKLWLFKRRRHLAI